jgi:hypothetical protein
MSGRRQILIAVALGTLGLLGLAAVAAGQAGDLESARKQYEIRLKQVGADANADAHIGLAKWCLKNGLMPEARNQAVQALKKEPKDVRAKYVVYMLGNTVPGTGDTGTGTDADTGTGTGTGGTVMPLPGGRKPVTIPEAEAEALMKEEGVDVIRQFRDIQQLLERRCATSQCHGATGTQAKWVLALQGAQDDRMLAENFRIVSAYVNRESPEQSPLLVKPLGGQEAGHPEKVIRGKTDPVYQRVVKYIAKLKTKAQKLWQ